MRTLLTLLLLGSLAGGIARSQTLTTLVHFNFTNGMGATDPIGFNPKAEFTLGPDGYLYGMNSSGSPGGFGSVFKMSTNGALTPLVDLQRFVTGQSPAAGLIPGNDGNFYCVMPSGGPKGNFGEEANGTVSQITTNGVLTNLHSFYDSETNGAYPTGLTLGNDGSFYGTTYGATYNHEGGTVFRISTNGAFATLFKFAPTIIDPPFFTNANGVSPSKLTLGPDGFFYGTTEQGNPTGLGTIFKITTNGSLTTLANFEGTNGASPSPGGLTVGPDGNFYGTASAGGSNGIGGAVFKVTTNGTLTAIHLFNAPEGNQPKTALTLGPDNNFYGTTSTGGPFGNGTVFKITTDGFLTTLAVFDGTNGARPLAKLTTGPDGNLYGSTYQGGQYSRGTAFRLTLPPTDTEPPLQVKTAAGKLVLAWDTNVFSLQSVSQLGNSFSNVAGATSPYTNAPVGDSGFFRLIQK